MYICSRILSPPKVGFDRIAVPSHHGSNCSEGSLRHGSDEVLKPSYGDQSNEDGIRPPANKYGVVATPTRVFRPLAKDPKYITTDPACATLQLRAPFTHVQ